MQSYYSCVSITWSGLCELFTFWFVLLWIFALIISQIPQDYLTYFILPAPTIPSVAHSGVTSTAFDAKDCVGSRGVSSVPFVASHVSEPCAVSFVLFLFVRLLVGCFCWIFVVFCFVFGVCFCFFLMGFHYICISHTGKHPKQSKGTLVRVYDVEKLDPKQWGFRVLGIQGNEMTVAVQSAPDAIVGSWTVFANLGFQDDEGKQQTRRNKLHEKVTLLFNTWCGGKCGVLPRNGNVVTMMKF